jgi:hypothetical protein
MQISKLLEIATANYDDLVEIYETVKDEDSWEKIELDDSSEKDNLEKVVELVDNQTYELMVPPLKELKRGGNKYKFNHEQQKNCNFGNAYSALNTKMKKSSNKWLWFSLYYEYLSKEGPWGLGMYISITELYEMAPSDARFALEKKLKKIVCNECYTTEELRSYLEKMKIPEEDIQEAISGGGVYFKPIELRAGTEISKIKERIVEIGDRCFIQKIPELKKFWQNELQGI